MNKNFKRAEMIFRLAINDFKSRYAGLKLGVIWGLAEPIVTILIYWFVYTVAFSGGGNFGVPYYVWLSVGMSAWLFISNGLNMVTASFREYSFLVKKMSFDTSVIPAVKSISAGLLHMFFLVLVIVICVYEHSKINIIYLVISILSAWLFIYSLGRILAILCGIYKDFQKIVEVVLNIGFWVVPVFWSADALSEGILRLIYLNPVTHIVEGYRNALLYAEPMMAGSFCYVIGISVVLLLMGKLLEKKYLPDMADRL